MSDLRTAAERRRGYPPGEATVIRRCTLPVMGRPHRYLFAEVTAELIDHLNTPGLTPDDLFATFRDVAGSFSRPSLHDVGAGRWLRHFGLHPDRVTAQRLLDAKPQTWLDILRVPGIGPDTLYDLFRLMTVRWVRRFGEALGIFVSPDGLPVDRGYLAVEPGPGLTERRFLRVTEGLPVDADDGSLFAFPSLGEYTVAAALPSVAFPDERTLHPSSDLMPVPTSRVRVHVGVAEPLLRIGVGGNSLRVFYDPEITRISVHPASTSYPAKHLVIGTNSPVRRDKNGTPCGSCSKFAYVAQEDLEDAPVRMVTVDPDRPSVAFHHLPPDRYVVAGHSEKNTVVATVRDVYLDDDTVLEVGLDHTFDLSRLKEDPPERAMLQGDIVRQHQRNTQWCGPYSLAHAFSYWAPHRFNPRADNGKWIAQTVRDQASTWLHLVLGFATLGLSHLVVDAFMDDPVPGTLQETLVRGCSIFGFSSQGLSYKGIPKSEALTHLKRWIYAGIPVIVTVDEKMDQGEGHWESEHYKTLVGYDDNATLRYTDDEGAEHTSRGAFFFANSGGMGETRGDPEVLSAQHRETHPDYQRVPIGNDADSYTVFWRKWKTGSIPTFSKSHWCLPVFPVNLERVYG